jgi:hypothetical protein
MYEHDRNHGEAIGMFPKVEESSVPSATTALS